MAADQAADVADIPVAVVHTKTVPQAISSLMDFNPEEDIKANQQAMESVLDTVKSGQLTTAVRDTSIDGKQIKEGQYMGIVDGKIVANDDDLDTAAQAMVKQMLDEDSSVVTILYGADGNEEYANQLAKEIGKMDDELDIEVYEGDQPVYPYLISVEWSLTI